MKKFLKITMWIKKDLEYNIKISYTLVSMTNFFDTCKKTPNVIK